jgi:hypothetical protein
MQQRVGLVQINFLNMSLVENVEPNFGASVQENQPK